MMGDGSTKQPSDKAAYVPFLFLRVKLESFSKIEPKLSKSGQIFAQRLSFITKALANKTGTGEYVPP